MKRSAIACLISTLSFACPALANPPRDNYAKLDTFAQVLARIEQSYVQPVDREALIEGAIKGLLRELDPHSSFFSPAESREFKSQLEGAYVGIGTEMGVQNNQLVIITTFFGGPAQKAGLLGGDVVVAIDGQSVESMGLEALMRKIRGEAGTQVKLMIARPGELKPREFTIERGPVHLETLISRLVDKDYGLVSLRSFGEDAAQKVQEAITQLEQNNGRPLQGLILDLRGNPGGYLEAGVDVVRLFLNSGLVVTLEGRDGNVVASYSATHMGKVYDLPLVVLIDESSASASEIVAAALQEHGRAMIVGARSFGKGSVQSLFGLPDGSSIKLTVAKYYSPQHRCIQALGVQPDVVVQKLAVSPKTNAGTREADLKGSLKAEAFGALASEMPMIYDLQEFTALSQLKAMHFARP